VEDWNWETIFCGHYTSIFNHCDVIGQQSNRIWWKTQNNGYWPFKVIQGHPGQYQSKARMRLSIMINTNWHPISYRFGVTASYCSNFGHCVFEPPSGGLGATYDVHLRLIGKRVVDFLLVLIKLFARCYSWGVASDNRLKIGVLQKFWRGYCEKRLNFRISTYTEQCWS